MGIGTIKALGSIDPRSAYGAGNATGAPQTSFASQLQNAISEVQDLSTRKNELVDDMITVGAGPDIGVFGAIGVDAATATGAGGSLFGGRLHFGFNPIVGDGEDGIRRKSLTIGADLRLLTGAFGVATSGIAGSTVSGSANSFAIAPSVSLSYQAF